MPSKLQLSINQPCHENWHNMNPSEQGRFCQACAKEVVDFTSMSDVEVLNYFLKEKRENVCGRLYNEQMNRPIEKPAYARNKFSWYWNYLVFLFLLLFKSNTGKAQGEIKPVVLEQAITKDKLLVERLGGISVGVPVKKVISVSVVDERDKTPVAGATIKVKGKNIVTITDANGKYQLSDIDAKDKLVISSVGYCTQEVSAGSSSAIVCKLKQAIMGDVVVVAGGISADFDYTIPEEHVALVEVKDESNNMPLRATITYSSNESDEPDTVFTNSKGIYKLRSIKERETIQATISAEGYADTVLTIEGWKFNNRKETRYVFLRKKATESIEKRIVLGGVSPVITKPLYIIDGKRSNADELATLDPAIIESVEVLKQAAAVAVYGSAAKDGVIIIITKKYSAIKITEAEKCKKLSPIINQSAKLN